MSTPREAFARLRQQWFLSDQPTLDPDLFTEDLVVEMPFAAPGHPNRIEGRAAFVAFAQAGRAALPVRFDRCLVTAAHETADPDVIVVEYELGGTVTTTGAKASAPFIGVLHTRDGRICGWREYQHTVAIAAALAGA
ncbi:nuclear transport factor 2 family protein [Catellatospora vulcania]|uniref:nuclear transport factor 2 family protein n=1 Tax=Catellatospora vulcania TaxID=1460450 RepID=UPI0012D49D48|nr:nuclear transport factor 2 family protein [Catellatospora vulcania]